MLTWFNNRLNNIYVQVLMIKDGMSTWCVTVCVEVQTLFTSIGISLNVFEKSSASHLWINIILIKIAITN